MLVLTRKVHPNNFHSKQEDDEAKTVVIINPKGDVLKVMLLRIEGNTVKLGFDFPSEYKILRAELWGTDQAQREKSAYDARQTRPPPP